MPCVPSRKSSGAACSLPDGQIRCVTCHDRLSPWKFHIRLRKGSKVMHAVGLRRPVTYENPASLPGTAARRRRRSQAPVPHLSRTRTFYLARMSLQFWQLTM